MRILGIDPGSRCTGWGLVQRNHNHHQYLTSGSLRLDPRKPLQERLLALAEGIDALLEQHRPDHCAIEQIFTARNARSALVLGHARGVILLEIQRHGVALHEYAPTQVKQAVTGVGRASKNQVNHMVGVLLGKKQRFQEDEADALAIALTHAAASRMMGRG